MRIWLAIGLILFSFASSRFLQVPNDDNRVELKTFSVTVDGNEYDLHTTSSSLSFDGEEKHKAVFTFIRPLELMNAAKTRKLYSELNYIGSVILNTNGLLVSFSVPEVVQVPQKRRLEKEDIYLLEVARKVDGQPKKIEFAFNVHKSEKTANAEDKLFDIIDSIFKQ